jgi:acetylornithine deacetylase/succinyl-diaminopimelate desuccinylase-like protein
LQHYVRLDTTNPPGNELYAARFLARVLEREGIAAQIIESAPGRANVYARLPGRGQSKALLLLHHMDVVPASADEWSVPPLSAIVRDGYVWGRGALDNKGAGVVGLMTMLMFKRLQIPLARDLVLLGVADEEAGGAYGARFLLERRPELFADVGFVLNEGGAIVRLEGGGVMYSVELAQKAPLWLRLTASGPSGHASAPRSDAASHALVRALARLEAHRFPIRVLPEVQAVFVARAQGKPEAERERYAQLEHSLQDPALRERLLADPRDAALLRNTLAITVLEGSDKENVLSPQASAVLDLRLLPGEDAAAVRAELVRVMAEPAVEVETLLSWTAHASPRETELFAAIEAFARRRDPGAPVAPNVIGGFTECNAFRARGITCYGFLPLRLAFDDFSRIHGKDERIAVVALTQGVLDLTALVEQFASP